MIVEWWVDKILTVFIAGLALLPEIDVETGDFSGALAAVFTFDGILPMHEILDVMKFLIAWTGMIFVLKIIQTLLAHMPWVGGGGA